MVLFSGVVSIIALMPPRFLTFKMLKMIKKDALKYAIISLFLLNIGYCCRHKTPQYFSRSEALEGVWFKEKRTNIRYFKRCKI